VLVIPFRSPSRSARAPSGGGSADHDDRRRALCPPWAVPRWAVAVTASARDGPGLPETGRTGGPGSPCNLPAVDLHVTDVGPHDLTGARTTGRAPCSCAHSPPPARTHRARSVAAGGRRPALLGRPVRRGGRPAARVQHRQRQEPGRSRPRPPARRARRRAPHRGGPGM